MKKLAVLFFAMLLCLACSSGNSDGGEGDDADNTGVQDADPTEDPDSASVPDADDSSEPASDADDAAEDGDDDPAGDGGTGSDTDTVNDSEVGPASDADNTADDSDAGTDDPEAGCPSGFECRGGYCANTNERTFFCAEDSDCGEGLTCTSASLPSGMCHGCSYASDCPGAAGDDSVRCLYGYCMRICSSDGDCNPGMVCKESGSGHFCGNKSCSSASDCPANYTCTQSSDPSEGAFCSRIRCK